VKRDLGALSGREHDLLVVGGGIHGVAAAWDAAQRGLSTALVEADDFGSGASWNSLKTIHGGLRYLQTADLQRVRESVRERRALLRIAPALVKPLRFVVPAYGHGTTGREALGVALWLNDLLSRDRNDGLPATHQIPPGRTLERDEVLQLVPDVAAEGLTGGALWTDAQVQSSERLTLGFVRAAADAGAVVANHVEATGFLRKGKRIVGVAARDRESAATLEIRARLVLNAAGPGMDAVVALAGVARRPVPLLRAINLVLKRPIVKEHAIGAASGGRFLFAVPWRDRSMIGTDYASLETPAASQVRRFLEECAAALPWAELSSDAIALVHRGRVPGLDGKRLATRHLLLDHEAADGVPGLVSVQGVKYTTARGVAEEAVDLVCRRLGRRASPCRTAVTPLVHARPLDGPLEASVGIAVRDEMARTLSDAVLRRLDLGTGGPPAEADVESVARLMASELGWTEARVAAEKRALAEAYRV
jgi:glycerol-3-phosphate dehydrogenase